MNPKERERLVDQVLDRALGPQLVEPRPGLEERILANLPAQPEQRPWWRWMWIPALAAAAVLALVIGMRVLQRPAVPSQQVQKTIERPKQEIATKPQPPSVQQTIEPKRLVAKRSAPRMSPQPTTVAVAEPRLDVFPSRGTLTPEERLLVAFVRQQPLHARTVALEQAAHSEEVQKYLEKGQVPAVGPSGITK